MSVREPILKPVAIADLRPTQMTVGIREVKEKRKRWHGKNEKKGDEVSRQAYDPGCARAGGPPLRHRSSPPGTGVA